METDIYAELSVDCDGRMSLPAIGFSVNEWAILLILIIVGVVIILLLKALIHFLLPIVAAVVVWYLTSNLIYAGLAFVAVGIIQLVFRRK